VGGAADKYLAIQNHDLLFKKIGWGERKNQNISKNTLIDFVKLIRLLKISATNRVRKIM
jgi:hypothetical protein